MELVNQYISYSGVLVVRMLFFFAFANMKDM